jgi:hypothetical protein
MVRTISNRDSVIDSRDVIERIESLKAIRQDIADQDAPEDMTPEDEPQWALSIVEQLVEWDESDEGDELRMLCKLADECDRVDDWQYGAQLIHQSYFVDYCKGLLEDIGTLPRNLPHYIVIDWQETADNLLADYTEVDFAGETYYVR